jgi:hypothetical protein
MQRDAVALARAEALFAINRSLFSGETTHG